MANIKVQINEPYFENNEFGICIDKIDYENESVDSKNITMRKFFVSLSYLN